MSNIDPAFEEWRPVAGYNGWYEVSSLGRVRSRAKGTTVRILKPGIASHGYPTVSLGRGNTRTVHSLVAAAFLGPRPVGADICHRNGVRADPRAANLYYATRSDNNRDIVYHGRRGLTVETILDMRARYASGEPYRDIARSLGIHPLRAWRACTSRSYSHVN